MKIAILGTENSHALAFTKLLLQPEYKDIELVGIYGYDDEANKAIVATGRTSYVAKTPDEFVGKVDGVIITARHGEHHYEYGMPYIKAGIPAFIDKPFTVKEESAAEMIAAAKEKGTLLCGGSCLKFVEDWQPLKEYAENSQVAGGYVSAPINMVNPYGGFYFYSQHLLEIVFTIFGRGIRAVTAACADESKDRLNVLFHYDSFDVVGQYYHSYVYSARVVTTEGRMDADASNANNWYVDELNEFLEMVKTGKMPNTYEELAQPVTVLNAIERSYKAGGKRVEL